MPHRIPLALLATALAAAAEQPANPGFEQAADGRPLAWSAHAWEGAAPAAPLVLAGDAAEGVRCLRLPAVAAGAAGAVSAPIPLPDGPVPLRLRLRLRASADYAGNQPWVFVSGHRDGRFLGSAPVALPALVPGAWVAVDALVDADRLPAAATAVHLNLASRRQGAAAPAGSLDVDQVSVGEDPDAPTVTIACDRFAQWAAPGEDLTFRLAGGRLPRGTRAVRATVRDSAGTVVEAAPADLVGAGWTWRPAAPGFYQVSFMAQTAQAGQTDSQEIPLASSYTQRTPAGRELAFRRAEWSVAVRDRPLRPMAARPAPFGFSYNYDGEESIRCADLLGMRWARIHWLPWGGHFTRSERAIEPERGVYRWEEADRKITWLAERGFDLVANVVSTPRWASARPDDAAIDLCMPGWTTWAPRDLGDWTRFLDQLVGRYGDRIRTWELWNEPHLPGGSCFWHDTPERFAALLTAGIGAIKARQPEAEVWIGGMGMRYLPFYRRLVQLGGAAAYDRLALHGSGVDPEPFWAIDRAAGLAPRPWVTSEHHGILLNPGSPPAGEAALARRLVLDTVAQLARGAERIALFQMREDWELEALAPAKEEGWFIHSSGLFRAHPRLEPRFAALAFATVIGAMQPGVRVRSQHRLGAAHAVVFANPERDLLLVWPEGEAGAPVPAALADAIAAGAATAIDWEGRPVPRPWRALAPGAMYLVEGADPALAAAWPAAEALPARATAAASHPVPVAVATWGALPEHPPLVPLADYVDGATPAAVRAAFALAGDERGLDLVVEVQDPEHVPVAAPGRHWAGDSLQIGIDTAGSGLAGDQVQFMAALLADGPVLWKDVAPYIGGDLPSGWTPAGRAPQHARAEITPIPGGLRYRLRIAASELYPLVPERTQPLRLSLLVNSNRGQGRAGWVEWGSGIGKDRDPSRYGRLDWR